MEVDHHVQPTEVEHKVESLNEVKLDEDEELVEEDSEVVEAELRGEEHLYRRMRHRLRPTH